MKSLLFTAIISTLLFSCGDDGRMSTDLINIPASASNNIEEDDEFAVIDFEVMDFDFGTIAAGRRLNFEFKFSNSGTAPLLIANVQSQCGCTVAKDWPKKAIYPGESGVIEVEFDSTDRTGSLTKRIDIVTNTRPAITQLMIKGNVIGPDFTKEDLQ
ncbi:MAG: hypothetical protein CL847_04240 [Crocinitomicaceae bacterium]|nr:hypothetical protein [Crocinitomicaceae bacterium]|tara:strand:+ start:6392 stop:6862 length:471 start_codon:yes stop_codon:yes gene_type:complete